ncbi:TPA: hypothetical protein ACH3X2_012518 [Trebouxia sp. C0005]
MRGSRSQAQVYKPPHASNRDQPSRQARTLGDLEYSNIYWKVELHSANKTLSYDRCPAQRSTDLDVNEAPGTTVLLFSGATNDENAEDLLDWFRAEACTSNDLLKIDSNSGPCMKLPTHISKEQRAHWHRLAEHRGLTSQSQGVGANRRLHIMCPTAKESSLGLSKRARQIWDWCQAEGGCMWGISQGEVAAMLQDGGQIPPDVQQLIDRREKGQHLGQLLQDRRADAALELLSAQPALVWVRDDKSGGYPLHIAVWHNLASVVTHILSTPNVTEQRDGRRDTPLMLARKRGLACVEQELLQAGANDLPSPSPSAGRTAWSAGQHRPYSSHTQLARNEPSSPKSYGRSLQYSAPAVHKPPGLSKSVLPDRPPGFA